MDVIQQKLKLLPDAPGVYIMLDSYKNVIYVGKARILKNRVRQYFHNSPKPEKVTKMVENIADFNYIITDSEIDALALENNLIKKYKLEKSIIRKPLVDQQELVYIYNSVEALVYPTRRKSESLGLTGLEAMACETLVIGSNMYGPSDYLKNDENSLTFNPLDDLEVADKIIEALNMSEKEKNKLTNKGRKTALSYSLENTKALFLSIFKN